MIWLDRRRLWRSGRDRWPHSPGIGAEAQPVRGPETFKESQYGEPYSFGKGHFINLLWLRILWLPAGYPTYPERTYLEKGHKTAPSPLCLIRIPLSHHTRMEAFWARCKTFDVSRSRILKPATIWGRFVWVLQSEDWRTEDENKKGIFLWKPQKV